MSDELVTIATFTSSFEANLAKQRLTEAGIPAFLADEQTVGLAWHLSNAMGGIRLQVSSEDASEALTLTAEPVTDFPASQTADPSSPEEPDGLQFQAGVPPATLTGREQNAKRALRGAVLGLFFLPVQLYVLWLLMKILFSRERLDAKGQRGAIMASILNLGVVLGVFLTYRMIASR